MQSGRALVQRHIVHHCTGHASSAFWDEFRIGDVQPIGFDKDFLGCAAGRELGYPG